MNELLNPVLVILAILVVFFVENYIINDLNKRIVALEKKVEELEVKKK